MQSKHWKRAWSAALSGCLAVGSGLTVPLPAQDNASMLTVPSALQGDLQLESTPVQYVQFAHFAIPFDVDRSGRLPTEVNLWVSPDRGRSWLKYATNSPDKRSFEFHAAAEGEYLFAVQTRDGAGASALAASPPMRILVDTTRPQLELTADINSSGKLVISYRIVEKHLDQERIELSYALDGQNRWEDIRIGTLSREGDIWSGSIEIEMPRCREIELKLRVRDLADNLAETESRYHAPRTAAAAAGMQLASGPTSSPRPLSSEERLTSTAGGVTWEPSTQRQARAANNRAATQTTDKSRLLGRTASNPPSPRTNLQLDLPDPTTNHSPSSALALPVPAQRIEELPPPAARLDLSLDSHSTALYGQTESPALESLVRKANPSTTNLPTYNAPVANPTTSSPAYSAPDATPVTPSGRTPVAPAMDNANSGIAIEGGSPYLPPATAPAGPATPGAPENSGLTQDAYHSRSRTFSLDYSVEALRGVAISDIELWGTTDRGQTWERWGSDPDRESPFDVQVGDDGLFGFRMVVIGQNGMVSNRPQNGDTADMWINVDSQKPTVQITRAMYGEGAEAGMLVIDYSANDDNLHDRPISLSFSERPNGPWAAIATGLRNTGIYLWKADPKLPEQVYVRIEAVDRAGNIQEHRLELPINLRGLTPRGRIQGFRPIDTQQ